MDITKLNKRCSFKKIMMNTNRNEIPEQLINFLATLFERKSISQFEEDAVEIVIRLFKEFMKVSNAENKSVQDTIGYMTTVLNFLISGSTYAENKDLVCKVMSNFRNSLNEADPILDESSQTDNHFTTCEYCLERILEKEEFYRCG